MNKISISSKQAYDAIIWASEQFGTSGYAVQNTFPADRYIFTFERPEQASMFALKWL